MIYAGKRYILYGSRSDEIRLFEFADLHYGAKGVAKERLRADIEQVRADPYAFWFGGGDYSECITYDDPRFDPECVDEDVNVKDLGDMARYLMGGVRDMFMPIAGKGLGMLEGNHERKYEIQKKQQGLMRWLCVELGVPFLEYSCMFDLVFVRTGGKLPRLLPVGGTPPKDRPGNAWRVRIYMHHGVGSARTKGAKVNSLERFMRRFDADISFVAHVHEQIGIRNVRLRADEACRKAIEIDQLGIIAGSYLRTYDEGPAGYGEVAGYEPVPLGAVPVIFRPDKRRFNAEV